MVVGNDSRLPGQRVLRSRPWKDCPALNTAHTAHTGNTAHTGHTGHTDTPSTAHYCTATNCCQCCCPFLTSHTNGNKLLAFMATNSMYHQAPCIVVDRSTQLICISDIYLYIYIYMSIDKYKRHSRAACYIFTCPKIALRMPK